MNLWAKALQKALSECYVALKSPLLNQENSYVTYVTLIKNLSIFIDFVLKYKDGVLELGQLTLRFLAESINEDV